MTRRNSRIAISRRTLFMGSAAFAALPSRRVVAQAPELLRIGFLTVNTGPLAAGGKQQAEGAAYYLKERGGMIAGRKIELITQDTAGNPALARTKTQELVERHNVPVIIGPLATNEALAIDGYIRDAKVPLITTTSSATVDLKAHPVNPWVLHAFGTAYPLGDYLWARRRRRFSARVRSRGRQNRAEALAAAERAGLRTLPRADQVRCGWDLHGVCW